MRFIGTAEKAYYENCRLAQKTGLPILPEYRAATRDIASCSMGREPRCHRARRLS